MENSKGFSTTIAGLWGVYGIGAVSLVNQYAGSSLDASCVENVGSNAVLIVGGMVAAGVAHYGRWKVGDVHLGGFKK